MKVVNPASLAKPLGYANGIVAEGRFLFVAGQVGWDAEGKFADGFLAQFTQALDNVLAVVREAGGSPETLARLTVYVTDKRAYLAAAKEIGAAWKSRLGRHYPAMALVEVKSLLEDRALCELEATCCLGDAK